MNVNKNEKCKEFKINQICEKHLYNMMCAKN